MPWVSRRANGSPNFDQPQVAHHLASRSASTAGAGSRARCRRCTGPPAASSRRAHRPCAASCVRAGVAQEVPGRIDEGVHGVGFAPRRARRTAGSVHWYERRRLRQRIAAAVGHQVLRQHHRQLLVRHRHLAAALAVDDAGSGSPSSAGARCPSRAGGTARACARGPVARAPRRSRRPRPGRSRPENSPEFTVHAVLGVGRAATAPARSS